MRAINSTRNRELAGSLTVADKLLLRMKGLLGRKSLDHGEGLWIKPCMGIHTFGMRFPIDVIFLIGKMPLLLSKKGWHQIASPPFMQGPQAYWSFLPV